VLRALSHGGAMPASHVTARDLMSPGVLAASPDLPVVEAVKQMLAKERKWLVVVDDQGHPLGLVDRQMALRAVSPIANVQNPE